MKPLYFESRETKFGLVATMGDKEIGVEVPSLKKEGSFWRLQQQDQPKTP
jgi:hypothetical protein